MGSAYGKPNKTILLSNVNCIGTEDTIDICDSIELTEEDGRTQHPTTNVAGVKCLEDTPAVANSVSVPFNAALVILCIALALLVLFVVVTIR